MSKTYQFLHAPPSDPRNAAGDPEAQLEVHVLHAISRNIPLGHLAKHLNCSIGELVESSKNFERRKIVGIRDGKKVILKSLILKHVSNTKMGQIYDLVTKDFPCHHIRIDDVGMVNSPFRDIESGKRFAVRYIINPSRITGEWGNRWIDRSRWQGIMPERKADTMSVEELAKEITKTLLYVLEPYNKQSIEDAAPTVDSLRN